MEVFLESIKYFLFKKKLIIVLHEFINIGWF